MHDILTQDKDKKAANTNPALVGIEDARALVVDVNPTSRSILRSMLIDLGLKSDRVKQVGRYVDARTELENAQYDIVLCDYHFIDTHQTATDLLDELRQGQHLPYSTVFVMVTSEATYAKVAEAAESALDSYLLKPHTHNELVQRLSVARHRKMVLADIFQALQEEDYALAAELCQTRFAERGECWVYAARIGGEILLRLNRHDEAKTLFEAIDSTKALPWARLGVARAQMESGQLTPARRTLESLIVDNPTYADAYDVMGRAQFQSGDFEDAYATYQHAVSLTPSSLSRLQKMGMLAFHLGKTEEASKVLERAVALGSTSRMFDFQSLVLLALHHFQANDSKSLHKCLTQLQKAYERAPRSARLRRMHELVNVLSLMQQRQVAEVVRRIKGMTREFGMADYDFEAASNMLSLLLKLRESELNLQDAELWISKLSQRFCISKAMTDMLCMMVRQHEPYETLVRDAYHLVGKLAEQALGLGKSGRPHDAVELLLKHGQTSGNTKLIDLAEMVLKRYAAQLNDPDLTQRVNDLKAKYGPRAVGKPAR